MYEYVHGGDIYDKHGRPNKGLLDFSANISPLGMPPEVIHAAQEAVKHADIYPDSACRQLSIALAAFEGVGEGSILCANGASDLIFRIAHAIRPQKVMVTAPTFADYERAGSAAGAKIIYYPLSAEDGFAIPCDIVSAILTDAPNLVFICNPNNPTGNVTDIATIREIATVCQSINAILVIDECFIDFITDAYRYTAKPLLGEYKNIVILKAFTKMFAMPGLRLGYAICEDEELFDHLRFIGPDWAVSNIAQAAGLAALASGKEYIQKTVAYIRHERERMATELTRLGFAVYPSEANFILFKCRRDIDLRGVLLTKGIMVRDCSNYKGLGKGFYRTAVLTTEKNTRFLDAMNTASKFSLTTNKTYTPIPFRCLSTKFQVTAPITTTPPIIANTPGT